VKHLLTPQDLNCDGFDLIKEVDYANLKPFILEEIKQQPLILRIYGFVQLLALATVIAVLVFLIYSKYSKGMYSEELLWTGIAIIFSCSALIIIHELLHGLAFLVLGKKDIGFGAQWRKFIFYAEANLQVLDKREMIIVALTPLTSISLLCLTIVPFTLGKAAIFFPVIVFLIHLLFCAGDLAIVSYFSHYKNGELFTYDDRKYKKSYFYKKKESVG